VTKGRERSLRSAKGSSREIHAYESGSRVKLPSLKSQFSLSKRTEGTSSWHLKRQEEEKKKKRITFDLSHGDDEGSGGWGGQLQVGSGMGGEIREFSGIGKGDGGKGGGDVAGTGVTGAGGGDVGGRTGSTSEGGEGDGGGGGGDDRMGGRLMGGVAHDQLGKDVGREGESGGNERGSGHGGDSNSNTSFRARDNKGRNLENDDTAVGQRSGLSGDGNRFEGKDGGLKDGMGGSGGAAVRSSGQGDRQEGGEGVRWGEGGGEEAVDGHGGGEGEGNERGSTEGGDKELGGAQVGRGTAGSVGGAGRKAGGADVTVRKPANTFLKPTDHGKRIRKSGGYMRAVSPTSSEWGDPLHARSFLSSTATSQVGSTSDLTGDRHDMSETNDPAHVRGKQLLPPIVHPIPPPAVSIDFMTGPELTRPWTFSYHH
jgi:hypothetical protein